MKISKQEQIFIIIFIVAAIIGVGFFIFVLPNFNNIDVNNKNLDKAKKKYAELQETLKHEATIDDEIRAAYEEGKNLANSFYDDLTTYEADEIMRQFIAKGKDITIDGLSISPFSTSTLSISTFNPTEVTYPLKDFANTVVKQEAQTQDITKMNARERMMYMKSIKAKDLASSKPVTVGSITVSFKANSDKLQNLHDFVDLLYDGIYDENIKGTDGKPQKKATYLSSVTYQMENEVKEEDNAQNNTQDENNESKPSGDKSKGYSMSLSVQFFCIKPVADPFATQTAQ